MEEEHNLPLNEYKQQATNQTNHGESQRGIPIALKPLSLQPDND
jgi:hypothetical protein